VFSKPPGGWSGVITAPAVAGGSPNGFSWIALEDPYLFVSMGSTVEVSLLTGTFGHKLPRPSISHVRASGLARGRPELSFKVQTPTGGPLITGFALVLPRGLSFTKSQEALAKSVSVTGGAHQLALKHGRLVTSFTFATVRYSTSITIRPGALRESRALRTRSDQLMKLNRTHRSKQALTLRANVSLSETLGSPVDLILRIRIR
jgi:hypothetical protein